MSGSRRLWIRFRRLAAGTEDGYLDAVEEANRIATGHGAHFWAFEVEGRENLIVEFLEGPSDAVLGGLAAGAEDALASAAGAGDAPGRPVHVDVEPEGLKCAELGAPE